VSNGCEVETPPGAGGITGTRKSNCKKQQNKNNEKFRRNHQQRSSEANFSYETALVNIHRLTKVAAKKNRYSSNLLLTNCRFILVILHSNWKLISTDSRCVTE
jgi:hypothetical protein